MLMRKLIILFNAIIGYIIKFKIDIFGIGKISKLNTSKNNPRLVVSLTTYGRRVNDVVYYTLVSLLKQTRLPDVIILWLDNENWNQDSLPSSLKSLQKYGVRICFYDDIRSYKKLIPTIKEYSNDVIITVDDDVYYSKYTVDGLYNAYLLNPDTIHSYCALVITFDENKQIKPYTEWQEATIGDKVDVFPVGVGGVLYPPNLLHKDTLNEDLFMKLCPAADDIWFWFMANMNNVKHKLVKKDGVDYSFDNLYQYFHQGSALTHSNKHQNRNDIQFKAVMRHYGLLSQNLIK